MTPAPTSLPVPPDDDSALVVRAQQQEAFAFDLLYRRHVQFVASVVFRIGRRQSDVDDIVQDTFIIAFKQLQQLQNPAAFRGWLARIAVSVVHRRVRLNGLLRLFRSDEAHATLESMASPNASPETLVQLARLDAATAAMSLKVRTAWVLRMVLGCTLEEVATGCDCSLATAKRRLAEAQLEVDRVLNERRFE